MADAGSADVVDVPFSRAVGWLAVGSGLVAVALLVTLARVAGEASGPALDAGIGAGAEFLGWSLVGGVAVVAVLARSGRLARRNHAIGAGMVVGLLVAGWLWPAVTFLLLLGIGAVGGTVVGALVLVGQRRSVVADRHGITMRASPWGRAGHVPWAVVEAIEVQRTPAGTVHLWLVGDREQLTAPPPGLRNVAERYVGVALVSQFGRRATAAAEAILELHRRSRSD